jgi:lipoprotein-releasing system ATP-binding protein
MLIVNDLHKSFDSSNESRIDVLKGVTFDAREGEMISITGASGAGKSTLLQILGGLDRPDTGTVVLDGFDITSGGEKSLPRFRAGNLGFIFQSHRLLPDLNAVENVSMPLLIGRASRKESHERALQALSEVGLEMRARHPVGHLSGGEQQRVAFARAMVAGPRLLLADEPTGNLDASNTAELGELLHGYCRSRRAIAIVATHNEQLASVCDRGFLLQGGTLKELTFSL